MQQLGACPVLLGVDVLHAPAGQDQRAAIVLVDVEGLSVQEAAEILGCPTGTVKSRCSRGRARLAEELAFMRNRNEPDTVIPKDNTSKGGASNG